MIWEWDEEGDDRVADLWHLRAELSTSRKVVYTKWYQGRATYFSRPVFAALLRLSNPDGVARERLSVSARKILEILEGESPLSTRELKRQAGLQGRANERSYEKALRELWERLLIVAYGEVEEGAFPSLAVGATSVLFEELYREGLRLEPAVALDRVRAVLAEDNPFYRFFLKLRARQELGPIPGTGREARKKGARREGARRGAGARGDLRVVRFEDL
ncbi:MAG: hypothetical protein NDJ89_05845 [Oligoflexia bacterium]|nr:hypothetical protein [Oligoflexia bacterium]